jgi:hypothetical protein
MGRLLRWLGGLLLIGLVLLLVASAVSPGTVTREGAVVRLSGPIGLGTPLPLAVALLRTARAQTVVELRLDSAEGDALPALLSAIPVHGLGQHLRATVPDGAACGPACGFLFAFAKSRAAASGARFIFDAHGLAWRPIYLGRLAARSPALAGLVGQRESACQLSGQALAQRFSPFLNMAPTGPAPPTRSEDDLPPC